MLKYFRFEEELSAAQQDLENKEQRVAEVWDENISDLEIFET